jgi:membrane dipeptidase
MTFIIDAHQDIAFNSITFNRDIRSSALEIRKNEKNTQIPEWNCGECVVGWPEFQAGEIAVIFATLWMPPWKYRGGEWDTQAYQNPKQAKAHFHKQLDFYKRLTEENPEMFKLILNRRDLAEVLSPYENIDIQKNRPVGLVLLMEGAEGLSDPEELEEYYELGLRQVGPVWAGTRYCGGTKEVRPFDQEGRKLLEVMSSLGLPMDISHMSENAALTALDIFDGQVFASHANSRTLLKGTGDERHLTDAVVHRLLERNGTIGVLPYNKFLLAGWTPDYAPDAVTINHLTAQIDYYCQLAGNSTQTGIGSDLDGGFGFPQIPQELDTIKDLQKLKPALLKKGYSQSDVANIFGLNWKRHLETVLPE